MTQRSCLSLWVDAGGEPGVHRALAILESEVVRTMQLLGATSIDDLHSGMVLLR